ncbi:MAG: hypothetical protein HY786_03110 [Deltaproteobacteria bacterium]|nr:hypothetical protein [Deltaproteobacteria bacterium]
MNRKNLCFQAALCISIIFTTVSFAQSPPIFGPKTYTREKGKPEKTKETFQVCALSGIYKLIVENGYYTEEDKGETDEDKDKKEEEKKEKKTRVSAGEIEINGKEIVEEDDFNKKATRVEKTITLPEGETLMEVEVEGKPGAYITVTIECISGCLEVNISSPARGSAINKSKTIIN